MSFVAGLAASISTIISNLEREPVIDMLDDAGTEPKGATISWISEITRQRLLFPNLFVSCINDNHCDAWQTMVVRKHLMPTPYSD